ncbi:MAG: threonine ammonia-lyase, biosynthetic [Methylacidiphilales bacterium]|nr:threonine ammonia-lyase, biosynthetic [Candidatus Methylacidiphilales bacterium]
MQDSLFIKILNAHLGRAKVSRVDHAELLSAKLGKKVLLKREDTQICNSFKLRGSFNKAWHISQGNPRAVFCCASAGNHAQGVALAAQILGHRAVIVVPTITPTIKLEAIKRLNATVLQKGENFDQAYQYACALSKKNRYAYIHPYDDELVIAGQGTVGLEIHQQIKDPLDTVFVPVGGGGLLTGVAVALNKLRPSTTIIAVEANDSAGYASALKARKRIVLPSVGLFADGTAVKQVGRLAWKYAMPLVKNSITVTTDEICSAIKILFEETRAMVEPAGALSLAGLMKYYNKKHVKRPGAALAIISGANLNFNQLRFISERTQVGERSEAIFAVTIPEKQGSFLRLARLLGKIKITECNYRYTGQKYARVFCGLEIDDSSKKFKELIKRLSHNDFQTNMLTDSDIAKTHVRYMVGGVSKVPERVYRFEFPEKPGALLNFLTQIHAGGWNISLFHYRNHGSDYGRVLCGFQGVENSNKFILSLGKLNLEAKDITDELSYQLFLKSDH